MSEEHQPETTPAEERRPPPGLANGSGAAPDEPEVSRETVDTPPPSWREDWRSALAGGDEKKLKQLERFSTPENWARKAFEADAYIRSGKATAHEPPEEATEVELKAWRKQAGIPETPEGYEISFPKELGTVTENDKTELNAFLASMHSKHVTPRAAKAAFEWYITARAESAERAATAAEDATLENRAELRKTYPGREYKRNIGLANDYLNSHFEGPDGQQALNQILDAKLENGVKLSDHAPFIQAIVAMARRAASEDDLISGDAGGGARSVDEEYKELAAKPRLSEAERERMTKLAEARLKREERMAAR